MLLQEWVQILSSKSVTGSSAVLQKKETGVKITLKSYQGVNVKDV